MRITPEHITDLKRKEIFCFGANLAGRHGKGAALEALQWGAKYGIGEGLQGQTYAIPTKDEDLKVLRIDKIYKHIQIFKEFVKKRKDLIFLVTPIGTGLAGYHPAAIAPMFKDLLNQENVYLPKEFIDILTKEEREKLEHWNNLKNFEYLKDIPALPVVDKKEWLEFYVPRLIKAGAIPLDKLEDGECYYGQCRNAKIAQWHEDKKKFTYWRHKFGEVFEEDINHFEDDNKFDLFVPIKKATIQEFNTTKL